MEKIRVGVSVLIVLCMTLYVGWVFYISEPAYIDNCNKIPEKFDLVSINPYSFEDGARELGLILQRDSTRFIAKMLTSSLVRDDFKEFSIESLDYRIIGSGTIYHKINCYVGFNIMIVTQIFISILLFILMVAISPLIKILIYKE